MAIFLDKIRRSCAIFIMALTALGNQPKAVFASDIFKIFSIAISDGHLTGVDLHKNRYEFTYNQPCKKNGEYVAGTCRVYTQEQFYIDPFERHIGHLAYKTAPTNNVRDLKLGAIEDYTHHLSGLSSGKKTEHQFHAIDARFMLDIVYWQTDIFSLHHKIVVTDLKGTPIGEIADTGRVIRAIAIPDAAKQPSVIMLEKESCGASACASALYFYQMNNE